MYLIPNCIMYGKDGKNSVLPVFPQAKRPDTVGIAFYRKTRFSTLF